MTDPEIIIKEYRAGDLKKRLDLYLEFRSLRCDFDQVEKEEASDGSAFILQPAITRLRRTKKLTFRPIKGCLKWFYSLLTEGQ